MIVVTGAAGMIGSTVVRQLVLEHDVNPKDIMRIDTYIEHGRWPVGVPSMDFKDAIPWMLSENDDDIGCVIHLGAVSSTRATMHEIVRRNILFSDAIWALCTEKKIPLLYASSAATYGVMALSFVEFQPLENLHPVSPYAIAKHLVDLRCMALAEEGYHPPYWFAVKPFNVYGPGELHKGDMRSIILKTYEAVEAKRSVQLYEGSDSYSRDFVYVDDVAHAILWLILKLLVPGPNPSNGVYNIGTGESVSFEEVVRATLAKIGVPAYPVRYVPMPEEMLEHYQRRTRADIRLLRSVGYTRRFRPVSEGISDYLYWLRERTGKNKTPSTRMDGGASRH